MIVTVHSYPTSVSVTTNLSPMLPSTIIRVTLQAAVTTSAILTATINPLFVHNQPQVAGTFNRVPNYVPPAYVAAPVGSMMPVIRDYPIIDNARGVVVNSSWRIPENNKQGPIGVPSSYVVIQDFPRIAGPIQPPNSSWIQPGQSLQPPNGIMSRYQVIQNYPQIAAPVVYQPMLAGPTLKAPDMIEIVNQAINVEQNIWERIIQTFGAAIVRALFETDGKSIHPINPVEMDDATLGTGTTTNSKCTIACWFKTFAFPIGGGSTQWPIDRWVMPGFVGNIGMSVDDQGHLGVYALLNDDSEVFNTNLATLSTNTWYHIAVTTDDQNDVLKAYLNGSQVFSASQGTFLKSGTSYRIIVPGSTELDGRIDDYRLYNVALSASDVLSLAQGTNVSTGLIDHWKFDDNLNDSIGSINATGSSYSFSTDIPSSLAFVRIYDSVVRVVTKFRTLSETVSVSESPNRLAAKIRALSTETVAISESLDKQRGRFRALATETVAISDSVVRLCAKIRTRSETVSVSENLVRLAAKTRALSTETVAISESIARLKAARRSLATETVTVGENLARMCAKIRARTETVSIGESLTRLAAKTRALSTETVAVSDSVSFIKTGIKNVVRALTENVAISEILRAFKNGIELIPPIPSGKGGFTIPYKKPVPPRLKQIRYPVYYVPDFQRLERRKKLREIEPVIIPAFQYNIHKTVAPFVITNPAKNSVNVRFALKNVQNPVIFTGKAVPVVIPAAKERMKLHKASCSSFVMKQGVIERYGRRLNKIQKLMKLAFLLKNLSSL